MKKGALVLMSLVTLILLIWGVFREEYFSEWRHWQGEYKKILSAESFEIRPRQIVVPDLGTVDRCISCHLGLDDPRMAGRPQPFRTHPGNHLVRHDRDMFGCASCHGGEGRATIEREAHASLLPSPFNQALCGACHDPAVLKDSGAPVLARGLEIFQESGCLSCHKLWKRGGTLGPPLHREGDKGRHDFSFADLVGEKTVIHWHQEHFKDPQSVVPGSKMPKVSLEAPDIEALTTYLLSLKGMPLAERFVPRDKYRERAYPWYESTMTGEGLYKQFCLNCHGEGIEGDVHESLKRMIPAIRNPDFLAIASEEFLIRNIRDGRPGTEMQAWGESGGGLGNDEIEKLASYLLEEAPPNRVSFVPLPQGDTARGGQIYRKECLKCHVTGIGENGIGDATWLGSSVFQETYSDAMIGQVIQYGRRDTLMEPYGQGIDGGELTDQEITDLVAFIRTLK